MLLWIMSDLHLELTQGWTLPPPEIRMPFDVMIVAGDVIPRMERGVRWLIAQVTDRPVLYVPGNHESYGCDIDRTVEKAKLAARGSNVHVLQNETLLIDDVLFIGATLWTDFALFGDSDAAMAHAAEHMHDYRKIRKNRYQNKLRPVDTLLRHRESRGFIERATRESDARRIVVITHHGPVRQTIEMEHEEDIISAAYVSDIPEILENVDLWVYGHTHESRDFMMGRTRIVSNSKGYGPYKPILHMWDNMWFNPDYVIDI